ncbi:MAG: TIGR02391 family protein [Gemmatimonadaceae bacterium]
MGCDPPKISGVTRALFDDGHYADAAETAFKAVNMRGKTIWKAAGRPEKDGKALMLSAFSVNQPTIRLDDLSTESGKNIQEGYMHIYAGAIQAIRNPKAHEIISITPERALHFLVLASLLMFKLDEAAT